MVDTKARRKESEPVEPVLSHKARRGWATLLARVEHHGERIEIKRYGKVVAALVPAADLEKLSAA